MALAFAEDAERNLVGELPVNAIVQMIAGNLVDVKELGMGRGAASPLGIISRVNLALSYISLLATVPISWSLVALRNKCVNCTHYNLIVFGCLLRDSLLRTRLIRITSDAIHIIIA
jgi:hypothetical protein